jgi:uncharacterized repeat protein (TIGR02543 family)
MKKVNKILSVLMALLMMFSIIPMIGIEASAMTQVEQALSYAANIAAYNPHAYDGLCLKFVGDCYESAGYGHYPIDTAYHAGDQWIISTSSTDIPVGALVFFDYSWNSYAGHVGIYAGNGKMYDAQSAYGGVQLRNFKTVGYRGWGWYGGIAPSGSSNGGSSPATCSCSTSYEGEYVVTTGTSNYDLSLRAGHGTNYSLLKYIPNGTTIYVTKGNGSWAHTSYAGFSGYVSMTYLTKKVSTYTVSYNANGGSGAPSSQTKTQGTALTLSSTIPTRTGYTFLGWSPNSTATTATYSAGGNFTTDANTTLYAVWKAKTYTVSYNANGGSGAPSSQTKTYGKTLTLSSVVPIRSGYTFLGWSTSSTTTTATYSAGGNFTSNANTTLYAVWKQITFELTMNSSNNAVISNDGDVAYYAFTPSTSGKYVIYSTGDADTKVALYNSAGAELASNDDVDNGNRNFRLEYNLTAGKTYRFAVRYYSSSTTGTIPFKFGKVYTVTYYANGGTGAPMVQYVDYGKKIIVSDIVPVKEGCDFEGWRLSSLTIQPGTTISVVLNADVTLTAEWFECPIIPSTDGYYDYGFHIQTPSRTSIRNQDTIILHTKVDEELPEGYSIKWEGSSGNFSRGCRNGDKSKLYATAENNGSETITAILYNADGVEIARDSVELYSDSGFFQKIGGIFRLIFGTTTTYAN